jgi:1-acyl-sn-glycerol-3-phosphate acyltransferase
MTEPHEPTADLPRDPDTIREVMRVARPLVKLWHRSEVRGLENLPEGGSLIVSTHSRGLLAMDFPVLAVDFYERFGVDRPLYLLSHGILYTTPLGAQVEKAGLIRADPEVANNALRAGATLMVFPGGDWDAARPSCDALKVDFRGRKGYIRSALAADVPLVPAVSIGGHENQLYLSRGEPLVRLLKLKQRAGLSIMPVTFGFPWGLSIGLVAPMNVPLPTKIVTQVLPPIDLRERFGPDPDLGAVDEHVRAMMQSALDQLARERRLPVIG